MFRINQNGLRQSPGRQAFTLIEIIVAMTIIAVITAIAVPTLKGLNQEERVKAPLATLAEMVQEVRQRAMKEHRPYEIIFEREGLHGIPGNRSFARRDEFLKFLDELRTPPEITIIEREVPEITAVTKNGQPPLPGLKSFPDQPPAGSESPKEKMKAPELPWTQTIPLDGGLKGGLLMWGDGEWDVLEGDRMRRWVFQANGMASPVRVKIQTGTTELEAAFDVLTGEMTGERSRPTSASDLR